MKNKKKDAIKRTRKSIKKSLDPYEYLPSNELELRCAVVILDKNIYKCMVYVKVFINKFNHRRYKFTEKNFYSRGYYERMTDGNWEDLPYLPNNLIKKLDSKIITEKKYLKRKKLYRNHGRIGIKINGKQKYMTLYSFLYDDFISFLEKNNEIKEQYDKYNTIDFNNDGETKIKSYYNLLSNKNNRKRFLNKTFYLLIMNNEYIANFNTSSEPSQIKHMLQRFNYKINTFYKKISVVLVNPKYRRLGVAYKMLNLLLGKGKQKYYLIADKSNLPAVKLYKKLGFIEKAENKDDEILFTKNE